MEAYYKERLERADSENNRLHRLLLEQYGEMATLRIEVHSLREKMQGKSITEKERRLIRLAKDIINEFDREDV